MRMDGPATTQTPPPSSGTGAIAPVAPAPSPPSAAASPVVSSRLGVLRHRHFRTVWLAAFGSFVGGWFEFVGTQWIITERTGSMLWASYLGAAQLAPTLVLGLLGGVVADRVNRRTLLLVTQAAMMLLAAGFALVVWLDSREHMATTTLLYWLLALSLGQGVAIAFNNPAWQVLIPRLVPREDLVKAITLQGISFNAARAIGPALAGVIMSAWSPVALFVINAVSFTAVMAAVMTTPDAPAPSSEPGWWRRVWGDTKAAGAFVLLRRGPRAALLACVIFAALGTPVLRFLALFVSDVYGRGEKAFGVLTGIMGVGAVAGGLAMRVVPGWYPRHHFIPLSVMLGGFWILLFSVTGDVYLAGVFMFFVGWFWMWAFNSSMASLQLLVDDSMRGRAMAVCNTVALGLMPAGYFFASAVGWAGAEGLAWAAPSWFARDEGGPVAGLATQFGVGLCALLLMGAGAVMMTYRTPEIDGLSPGDQGYDRAPGFLRGLFAASHRPRG